MKVLSSIVVFSVAAIGVVVGQFGRSLDRQGGQCSTATNAYDAINDALHECGEPDWVNVVVCT